jgi:phage-related minor tail protein
MAGKKTELSIILTTVDKATAPIRALNARLQAMTKPLRGFKEALGNLRETSGIDDVIGGFKGVGSALAGVLSKLALIGGVVAGAVAGMMSLIDQFDAIGDLSDKVGIGVDAIAQLRYAAARSGVPVEQLDAGLANLSKNLGLVRANSGPMTKFLGTVSPALLKQVKAAKSNEEAFGLLADAMAKLTDPAKRAAFAQKTLGDASLAPLLARGSAGIKELRDHYAELAGPQADAVAAAGEFGDSMDELHATTDGIKAALVSGLAPALKVIVDRLREWFGAHRADVKEWAAAVGKKLPGAVGAFVKAVKSALKDVLGFVDAIGGWKVAAVALAAVMAGPLISAIASLGVALLTTFAGWIALIAGGVYVIIKHWDGIKAFFADVWNGVKIAFSAFWGFLKDAFLNYTPLGLIIKNWGPIKGFFVDLWEGVKAAFMAVINFIVGKVEWVVGKIKAAKDWLTGDDDPEAKALLQAQMAQRYAVLNGVSPADAQARVDRAKAAFDNSRLSGIVNQQLAKVQIELKNAPRGTRVTATEGGEHLDLSVGYQLGAF